MVQVNLTTVIIAIVGIILVGSLIPTVADGIIGGQKVSKELSATILADIYVNDSANNTELQIKYDITSMVTDNTGTNVTYAPLCFTVVTGTTPNAGNLTYVSSDWDESTVTTNILYEALTLGTPRNVTFSGSCLDIHPIINTYISNDNISVRVADDLEPLLYEEIDTVFNTPRLEIGDGNATTVIYSSRTGATAPTLTIYYEYSIGAGTVAIMALVPLFVVLLLLFAVLSYIKAT